MLQSGEEDNVGRRIMLQSGEEDNATEWGGG